MIMIWPILITIALVLLPSLLTMYGLVVLHRSELAAIMGADNATLKTLVNDYKTREEGLREEIKALTESLVRAEGKFLVYPRKQATEVAEGWFEGKSKIVSTGPLVASDAAIREGKRGNG